MGVGQQLFGLSKKEIIMNYEHIDSWKNKSVFEKQLSLNQTQISDSKNYPPHWTTFLHLLRDTEIKSFLDVGCGAGIYYELLRQNYPDIKYTGTDYSAEAIDVAKEYWKYDNFYVMDIMDLTSDYAKQFDLIHLGAILDVLPNANEVLDFVLSLDINYLIISRLEFSTDFGNDVTNEYIAYDEITTYRFRHSFNKFNAIVQYRNYKYTTYEFAPRQYIIELNKIK